jgi:hypothetical protein
MAALPPNRVSKGFWIDHTHGPVLGAIITISSSDANLVIALLSVLVSFTGSHLWDLIAFVCFWTGVSNQPRSALHHQVQILIRNITSPGAFLLETALVGWSWRHHGALSKLTIVAPLAILCSAGFLVAGIFVSQIVSTSGLEVLAQSDSCGWVSWCNETTDRNRDYQETILIRLSPTSKLATTGLGPFPNAAYTSSKLFRSKTWSIQVALSQAYARIIRL